MNIAGWTDGRIVEVLMEYARGTNIIVEIGTYLGKSALNMASVSGATVYCIDTWEDFDDCDNIKRTGLDALEQFIENIHKEGMCGRVIPIARRSVDAVSLFKDVHIDLLYVDGDHSYNGVKSDLELYYELTQPNGIVCGDDWKSPSVSRAVLDFAESRGLKVETRVDDKMWMLI